MARLLIAPDAAADLEEIWLHIATDSISRADAFLDRIDDRLHLLAVRPHMGRNRPELGKGIHSWAIGRYIRQVYSVLSSPERWHRGRPRPARRTGYSQHFLTIAGWRRRKD